MKKYFVIILSLLLLFSLLFEDVFSCDGDWNCPWNSFCIGSVINLTGYSCSGGSCVSIGTAPLKDCTELNRLFCGAENEVWEEVYGCNDSGAEACCIKIDENFVQFCDTYCEADGDTAYCLDSLLAIRTRRAVNTATSEGRSAVLVGELVNIGWASDVDVWFEWGSDSSLSDAQGTAVQNLIDSTIFSQEITFETPQFGERYYFRAVTESDGEAVLGEIFSFVITKAEGVITVNFGGIEKSIKIGSGGSIEIMR